MHHRDPSWWPPKRCGAELCGAWHRGGGEFLTLFQATTGLLPVHWWHDKTPLTMGNLINPMITSGSP